MTRLELVLEPDARDSDPAEYAELARELTQLLRREMAVPVRVQSASVAEPRDARRDTVALATLILSIPQAALAMHDLARRVKLKECLQRVVTRARAGRARATWRLAADHISLPGDRERTLDEILDELSRAQDLPRTE